MGKAAEVMTLLVSGDDGKHESRHYGTVTAIDTTNDRVTVLLDGAEATTTCDSRDVKVTIGDRVEVEIRDHKATVKANSTHPVTDDEAAEAAWAHANSAATAASNAWTKAGEAATAASNAQTSANNAADAATNAWNHADSALTAAGVAWDYADTAKGAADQAQADATAAGIAASNAKQAADRSLVQLSIVEDVSGTLNWIAKHGTYVATTDTTVQDGTVYFELVSGDYVPIAQPTGNPQQQGWYVLDITDSQTEYIMAHLAVTSAGLWVLPSGLGTAQDEQHANGYKVLLSSTGMTVYDGSGDAVATYGESTTFASDRDWYVGSSNAFIFYDASENTIQIGGANVTIGGLTPGQLAGSQIWTATADPTTPNYTFAISNLTGPSGVSPRVGDLVVRSYYRYTISSVGTTTVLTGNRTSIRGGTGAAGSSVTVSSVEYAYQLSTSGTTVPTGTWGSTPVAPTATQYAWTRTTTTYSDNTTAVTYTVGGKGGADGSPGTSVTISSKSVKYQASTSGTTTPTGTWLDSVPTVAQGSYLWTRTVVTYSTGDSTTAYSVARMGSDGQTGAAGPEAVVSISVTAVDFSAGTATLSASLRVNGTVTTPTSYKWTKGTSTSSLGTSQTLSVSGTGALNATYNCTVTWSGGTQTGSIDLAATCAAQTYAAATFATQGTVTSMQSSIEANARQIALRATKTEAYQLSQPNLSPFFESTPYRTATSYDGGYWQPTSDNWLMNGVTYLSEGWAHVTVGKSKKLEVAIPRIESIGLSDKATLLIEWRGITVEGSPNLYARSYPSQCQFSLNSYNCSWTTSSATSGEKRVNMTSNASAPGSADWYAAINLGMSNGASVSFDGDLRISIYAGHDYAGPWKPYSGNHLYASQAELKVANDAIDARVEKDGVVAAINLSSESAKIQASKVEIDGAAIFSNTAFRQAADAAYDAKGSAASLIAGGDNLVGGFNNYSVTGATYNYRTGTLTSTTTTNTTDSAAYLTTYNGSTPVAQIGSGFKKVGSIGYWTFEKDSTFNRIRLKFNGNKADAAVYWDISSIPNGTQLTFSFKLDSLSSDGKGNGGVMSGINLRKGNMPSQWSLAPEDIEANTVKRTQRIWYRKASSGAPSTPSSWVSKADDGSNAWTKMHVAISSTEKYIYTCEQYEMADGTLGYTTVLLDNTITVIDGGSIITHSLEADSLKANSLTLGQISTSAQASMLNSNGLNLVSSQASKWKRYTVAESVAAGSSWATVSSTASTTMLTTVSTVPVDGDYVTISLASGWQVFVTFFDANGYMHTYLTWENPRTITLTNYSGVTSIGLTIRKSDNATITLDDLPSAKVKLERGNRATDWTPAPEDQTAYVDAVQVGGRNLLYHSLIEQAGSGGWSRTGEVWQGTAGAGWGLRFPASMFTVGESYVLSFYYQKVSGTLRGIGGHHSAFDNPKFEIDGTVQPSTFHSGRAMADDALAHYIVVYLKYNGGQTDNNLYIQPNRGAYSSSNDSTFKIWNIKIEKGTRATDWSPAPEDQTTYIDTSLADSVESITTTIDTEVGTLTDSITDVSNSLASLGGKVDGLVQKAAALEKKTQWVKWDDTEGMIFGENGTAFNTRLKAENMTFNYGNQTMMTLSATGGVDAPKVRTQRLELGSDWAITVSGDMFAIDYIGS